MKYRKKPIVLEVITFNELTEHGLNSIDATIVKGVPWSFNYNGHPITHENNECYLIPNSQSLCKMTPYDMLITGVEGEIYTCNAVTFNKLYEKAE